jgi:hypothetical protein
LKKNAKLSTPDATNKSIHNKAEEARDDAE